MFTVACCYGGDPGALVYKVVIACVSLYSALKRKVPSSFGAIILYHIDPLCPCYN